MNDIRIAEWQQWNIVLQDFTDHGVDLADIRILYIGFDDPNESVPGGSGEVYFDDIRLYLPRCLHEHDFSIVDIDDDCFVGFSDLRFIAETWAWQMNDVNDVIFPNDVNEPNEVSALERIGMFEQANIYKSGTSEDEVVNFLDFALLAARWEESQIFPQ